MHQMITVHETIWFFCSLVLNEWGANPRSLSGGTMGWLLSSKDKEIFGICDNCFYFSLHRENMIPDKLNFPGTGKCMVFVHQLDGFVLPCPVDLHQVKSNIKHFFALFRVGVLLIAFHQYDLGSISKLYGILDLNLCSVSVRVHRGFRRYGTPVFPHSEN